MWLVLCPSNDVAALWAYQGLKARGLAPLELVRAEELAYSVRWEHRLGPGGVHVAITLADGRSICSDTLYGVLNRLMWVPPEHLVIAHPGDRDYVTQELTAFYLSWLYALPGPMLNRPTPQGPSGQSRHLSEWVWLASKAGLPTPDYRQSSQDHLNEMEVERRLIPAGVPVNTVFVVAGHIVGTPAPPDILRGCQRLSELSKTDLLGIEFAAGSTGPWTFVGATPWPDLRLGGQALLDVLASVLRSEVEKGK